LVLFVEKPEPEISEEVAGVEEAGRIEMGLK